MMNDDCNNFILHLVPGDGITYPQRFTEDPEMGLANGHRQDDTHQLEARGHVKI